MARGRFRRDWLTAGRGFRPGRQLLAAACCCWVFVACAETERNPTLTGSADAGATAEPDQSTDAGATAEPDPPAVGQGGRPPLMLNPQAGTSADVPVDEDPCVCQGEDFGVTVTLGDDVQRLQANLAEQGQCAPDQPAHVDIVSGCGQHINLGLGTDPAGTGPRLIIDSSRLGYTDASGVIWRGYLPSPFGQELGRILEGSVEVSVTDEAGNARSLLLDFRLCAQSSQVLVPC
jgi:hypothetical protein